MNHQTWTVRRLAVYAGTALALLVCSAAKGQDTPQTSPPANPPANHSNIRKAVTDWKRFDYTCDIGAKVTVYLHDNTAKVHYQDHMYLMRQTVSADGNRYSDGKVVWWGKGSGGFLQEDTPDWNGKMIVQNCQLDKPMNGSEKKVTGTVSYLQRMALPPTAEILVQLQDVSLADAPAKIIAEQKIVLGDRQVPVPFELDYDPSKIDSKHTYSVSARITVDGQLRFITDTTNRVITQSSPTDVELVLKAAGAPKP